MTRQVFECDAHGIKGCELCKPDAALVTREQVDAQLKECDRVSAFLVQRARATGRLRDASDYAAAAAIIGCYRDAIEAQAAALAVPAPDETRENDARTVRSLACMLGWENVPPREVLERSVSELKARAAQAPPPDPPGLLSLGAEMARQNNHCTAHPLYLVQSKKRIYGIDPNYVDATVWLETGDYTEADAKMAKSLEREYDKTGRERDGWTRTAALDLWEFVTVCLTERAAKDYIARNGHRHKGELRMFVDSAYRNTERRWPPSPPRTKRRRCG